MNLVIIAWAMDEDHTKCEYGRIASIILTEKSLTIIGIASHDKHEHDSKILEPALENAVKNRKIGIAISDRDRGYQGYEKYVDCDVVLLKKAEKDSFYE